MSATGLFELTTYQHLLEKAEHDLERLRANHLDAYAAFDLFVTARHFPDWLYPEDPSKRRGLFDKFVELRVCRHIADGAKHFTVNDRRHRQVLGTERTFDAWGGAWRESWGGAWGHDELVIHLDAADEDTASLGSRISAIELGDKVLGVLKKIMDDHVP